MESISKEIPLDKAQIPEPILDSDPPMIDLYWKAWEIAWDHVVKDPRTPQSPYMDEGADPNTNWIWDTCFMTMFCKYSPQLFPGVESFWNFYLPMHEHVPVGVPICHLDNPPLFAWIEYENFLFTSDYTHLQSILVEHQFLQKHFEFIEHIKRYRWMRRMGSSPYFAQKTPFGFYWSGDASGMDNTPRGRGKTFAILWFDLLSQQGLAAENIARLAETIRTYENDTNPNSPLAQLTQLYQQRYHNYKDLLNKYYWNEEDGIYYDIQAHHPDRQVKVKTPAAFWPMLAGLCSMEQAQKLVKNLEDSRCFGGSMPWVSIARDDPWFHPQGNYWRGGIWVPLAYMGTKALERYGFYELADQTAYNLLVHMRNTYNEFEPHTIWEVYSPTEPKPATNKTDKNLCRPNFCGWSALAPISMLIENILGFHHVNAITRTINWRLYRSQRHGLRRFRFGTICTDIIFEDGTVSVESNEPFTLIINNQEYRIELGTQSIKLEI